MLARSNSPRAAALEYHPVSGKHELKLLLPVDPLVLSFTYPVNETISGGLTR